MLSTHGQMIIFHLPSELSSIGDFAIYKITLVFAVISISLTFYYG